MNFSGSVCCLADPEFDSGHIGVEFGRNEFLPIKSVSEALVKSGES